MGEGTAYQQSCVETTEEVHGVNLFIEKTQRVCKALVDGVWVVGVEESCLIKSREFDIDFRQMVVFLSIAIEPRMIVYASIVECSRLRKRG